MHKLSTAVPRSSTLTALSFLGLLGVLYEYACGAPRRTWRNALIVAPAALRHENLYIIPARMDKTQVCATLPLMIAKIDNPDHVTSADIVVGIPS